jgi:hypothetical protein
LLAELFFVSMIEAARKKTLSTKKRRPHNRAAFIWEIILQKYQLERKRHLQINAAVRRLRIEYASGQRG